MSVVSGKYTKTSAGTTSVSTGKSIVFEILVFGPGTAGGSTAQWDLELPVDARVERATCLVTATPGFFDSGSVAQVRATRPDSLGKDATACVLDFGTPVTVGALGYETPLKLGVVPIDRILRWTGASWSLVSDSGAFPEVTADRLLVETDTDVDAETFAEVLRGNAIVHLPAVPARLELAVDGVTVWYDRQGGIPGSDPEPPEGGVAYEIDRTEAIRQAFDRAPPTGATRKVRLTLRAATPGWLTLTPEIHTLHVHTVAFPPNGLAATVDLAEEGPVSFDVTPPPSAAEVAEIAMVVRGSFGPDRVQPATGPPIEPEVTLALVTGRPLLLGIPAALAARFGELTGLRLWLRAPVGTELSGRLLADQGGVPGAPLDGADLVPLPFAAGPGAWRTLSFTGPVPRPPAAVGAVAAWLDLHVPYGELECGLTAAAPDDSAAPGAPLLRRLPGGGVDELTVVPAFGVLRAALRLIGRPDADHPIPAVTFAVPRSDTELGVNPTGDDLRTVLALAVPVRPAQAPPAGPGVELTALVTAAGALTVDTVRVAYREGAQP